MSSRFVMPLSDVGDGIKPADGAKLAFYASGTDDDKNTYSDEGLATANANPVIADADGVFPDIWIEDGDRYKVRLFDKNDVQIRESDPVIGGLLNGASGVIFNTAAEARAASLVPGRKTFLLGYHEAGDGNGGEYLSAAPTAVDDYIDLLMANTNVLLRDRPNGLLATNFGVKKTGLEADAAANTLAFQAWADALGDNAHGIIPPGEYAINTSAAAIGFYSTNIKITAVGAKFVEYGTSSVCFDLNKNATPTETDVTNSFFWEGGRFNNNTAVGSNTNIGFRVRGITRGEIKAAFGSGFGGSFIENSCKEAFDVLKCSGFSNNIHVHAPAYQTTVANPQAFKVADCGWSTHVTAGVYLESSHSAVTIDGNFFIGKNAIISETGADGTHGSFNNIDLAIRRNSFEQGETGEYYVKVLNTNGRLLLGLVIDDNDFQVSATKCIKLENVTGAEIGGGNKFVSSEEGFIDLDVDCKDISFGKNVFQLFLNFNQGLAFACDRSEITFTESVRFRDVLQLSGWNFTGISTSTGTLDMSALIGTYWDNESATKFCPPKAWLLRVRVEDSAKAAGLGIRFAKDVTETSTYSAKCSLDNVTAGNEKNYEYWVNADDAGDIYYAATASGANTLKVQIFVVGWAR